MASRETKIKVERLRDLEADDYAHFTSPTYARGFVRTYARALGLDEYKILRQLDHKLPEDDHSTLVHESGVGYTPVPARPPRPGEGNTTGLFVITGLGLALMAIFAFVIFEAYRAGDLPRYFGSGSEASTAEPTNAPTASNGQPPAAQPVESATTDTPHAARALPVDPAAVTPSIVAPTDAASTVPNAVRALPVDPADLANGNPGAIPSAPAPVAAPAAVPVAEPANPVAGSDDTHSAPRALPVDPAELAAAANAANGPIPGTPVTAAAPAPTPVAVPVNPPTAAPVPVNVPPTTTTTAPADGAPVLLNDAGLPIHQPTPVASAPDASLASKRLVLTAANDSFVRVTAEDAPDVERVLYASVLHSGQSVGFDGHKFSVNVGVPSAVQITLDGVNYGPHSDENSPETFTVESHQP